MDRRTQELLAQADHKQIHGELIWFTEELMGYHRITQPFDYGSDYFQNFLKYETDGFANQLNLQRAQLVDKYVGDDILIDVGIGCGTFIKQRNTLHNLQCTLGYDIAKSSIQWLNEQGLFFNPTMKPCLHASFWDSLEHAPDASAYLDNVRRFAFISMPIFRDVKHILHSKHYKPNEHVYYFTREGLERFMQFYNFKLLEENCMEQEFGREDISTFVFQKQ